MRRYTDENGKNLSPLDTDSDLNLTAKYVEIPTFVVKSNDGTGDVENTYYRGETVTLVAATLENKRCDGWYTLTTVEKEDGEEKEEVLLCEDARYTFTVTEDVEVYAKYHESYKVIVVGGTGGGEYRPGETCTIVLNNSLTWRTFEYWRDYYTKEPILDEEGEPIVDERFSFEVNGSVTIEAVFVKNEYTVTYYVDGVQYGEADVLHYNDEIPARSYTPAQHYVFSGWSEIPSKMPAYDLEITGTTALETHRVMIQGGTGGGVYPYGTVITLIADDLESVGKRHIGWTENGADYNLVAPNGQMTVERDVTLRSKYEDILYDLIYYVTGADYGDGGACLDEDKYIDGVLAEEFPATLKYGETVPTLDNLYRDHYDFSGWSSIPATMPARNVTVTGSFSIHRHTLRVNNGYIGEDEELTEAVFDWGQQVTVRPTIDIGQKFFSWSHGADKVYDEPGDGAYTFAMVGDPDPSINGYVYELTARTIAEDYYIRYFLDGEEYEQPILKHYGDNVKPLKTHPKKDHYTFGGWHTLSGGEVPETMPAEDLYIYGSFSINRYTLTMGTVTYYNVDYYYGYFGDDEDCHEVTLDWGSEIRITATDLDAIGKDFVSWHKQYGAKNEKISQESAFVFTLSDDNNLAISAQFTDHNYTAVYYLRSPHETEYVSVNTQTYTYNSARTLWVAIRDANHNQHDWSGWYYKPVSERTEEDVVLESIPHMPAHDLTFYSECSFKTYDLTVGESDITAGATSGYINSEGNTSGTYEWSEAITLLPVIPYGYDFDRWTFNGNNLTQATEGYTVLDAETGEATYTVVTAGELKAKFKKSTFFVTVEDGYISRENGSSTHTDSGYYEYETDLNLTANSNPTGFVFDYWTKNGARYSSDRVIVDYSVDGPADFAVVWKNIEYGITYWCKDISTGEYVVADFGDERYPNPQTGLVYQQTVDRYPNMPAVDHYTFSGWRTMQGGSAPVAAQITMGADSKNFYGWYIPDRHTVTVNDGTGSGEYDYAETITVVADVPTGMHLTAWKDENENVVSDQVEYTFVISGDVTLTPVFEWTDYTVTYRLFGATHSAGGDVYVTYSAQHYGQTFPLPDDPDAIVDYGFAGWTVDGAELPDAMPASDVEVSGEYIPLFEYVLTEGRYRIVASDAAKDLFPATITLPTEYNGKIVIGLENNAFSGVTGVKEMTFGDGYYSFGTTPLGGLVELEKLTFVAFPSEGLFYKFFGESVGAVPSTLKEVSYFGPNAVPANAFANMSHLQKVTIDRANTIGESAFSECTSLTEVVLSGTGLSTIGDSAFRNTYSLTSLYYAGSVSSVPEGTFYGAGTNGDGFTLTLASSVSSIPADFFYNGVGGVSGVVPKLTSVVFEGNGLLTAGNNAFRDVRFLAGDFDLSGCTSVGSYAFYGTAITGLTLSDSLTNIGEYAFADCKSLGTLSADASIGSYAFAGSGSDMTIAFGSAATVIGDNAFYGAKIDDITFAPNGVTSIGPSAFRASSIASVVLPEGLTEIDSYAFASSSVEELTLPVSLRTIGSHAFADMRSLSLLTIRSAALADLYETDGVFDGTGSTDGMTVTIATTVQYVPAYLFYGTDVRVTALAISDSGALDEIGAYAFAGLSDLSSLYLGNTVRIIGERAFSQVGATEVILPYRAYYIGTKAFADSSDLTIKCQVEVARETWTSDWADGVYAVEYAYGVTASGDYSYVRGGDRAYLTAYTGEGGAVVLPATIDGYAVYDIGTVFKGNTALTSVVLPTTVEELYDGAFAGCTALTSVTGADGHAGIKRISGDVFLGDAALSTFNLTVLAEEIGNSAFAGCTVLDGVDLSNVRLIGDEAFKNAGLTEVRFSSVLVNVGSDAFFGCPVEAFMRVDPENDSEYYEVLNKSLFSLIDDTLLYFPIASEETEYTIPSSVLVVAPYAFNNAVRLTTLTLPEGLTEIGRNAFAGCVNLSTVRLLSVRLADLTADDKPFDRAGSAGAGMTIEIGASAEVLPAYLFYGTSVKMKALTFAEHPAVTEIGAYAFYNNRFETISLPSSLETLGERSLYGSTATSIVLGSDISDLSQGDEVFGATAGATVSFTSLVTRVPAHAFEGSGVAAVDLSAPEGVVIGASAFRNTHLTSIILTANLTDVESYAFADVATLTSVTVRSTVDFTGENIFYNSGAPAGISVTVDTARLSDNIFYASVAPNVKTVTFVTGTAERIGKNAFRDLTAITSVVLPEGIKIVEESAFRGDSGVTTLTVPKSVVTIRPYAFAYMDGLSVLNFNATAAMGDYEGEEETVEGLGVGSEVFACGDSAVDLTVNIGDDVVSVPGFMFFSHPEESVVQTRVVALNFPTESNSHLTSIGDYAFAYLTEATISALPTTVMAVGSYAFIGDVGLTSLTMAKPRLIDTSAFEATGLTALRFTACDADFDIGDAAFKGCVDLTDFTFNTNGHSISIGAEAFRNDVSIVDMTVLPNEITSFGPYAFAGCSAMTDINLGNVITSIPAGFNKDCASLSSLTLPATVREIGESAYEGCTSLDIALSLNVRVGKRAFFGCSALTSVTLGDSVDSVGESAFMDCSGLTAISIGEGTASIGNLAFSGTTAVTSIAYNAIGVVDDSDVTVGAYVFRNSGSEGAGVKLTIGPKVRFVPAGVFYSDESEPKVTSLVFATRTGATIPSLRIGESAFRGLPFTGALDLPEYVTVVDRYAFADCDEATALTLPSSLTTIGAEAFYGMLKVTVLNHNAVNLDETNFHISSDSVYGKRNNNVFTRLGRSGAGVTVNIAAGVEYIHESMFAVTDIDYSATPKVVSVLFASGSACTTIGRYAFSRVQSLSTFSGADNLTVINEYAFNNTALTAVPNADQLTYIGNNAFEACAALTEVTLGSELTYVGSSSFKDCTAITDLKIDCDGVTFSNVSWISAGGTSGVGVDVVFGKVSKVPDNIFYCDPYSTAPRLKSVSFTSYYQTDVPVGIIKGDGEYYAAQYPYTVNIGANAFREATIGSMNFDGRLVGDVGAYAFYNVDIPLSMRLHKWEWVPEKITDEGLLLIEHIEIKPISIGDYAFYGVSDVELTLYSQVFDDSDRTHFLFSVLNVGDYAFTNTTEEYDDYGVQFVRPAETFTIYNYKEIKGGNALKNYYFVVSENAIGDYHEYDITEGEVRKQLVATSETSTGVFRDFAADAVGTVGEKAFFGCGRLNGSSTFNGNFTSDSVHIGDYAFAHTKIADVSFATEDKPMTDSQAVDFGRGIFDDTSWLAGRSDGVVYIGAYYLVDEDTSYYSSRFVYGYKGTMPEDTTVTIADGAAEVLPYAFYGQTNMSGLVVPTTVKKVGEGAFSGCDSVIDLTAPVYLLTSIVSSNVERVAINGVDEEIENVGTIIAERTFYGCTKLTNVTICDGVTMIGSEAFRGCGNIESITLPDSVIAISDYAFYAPGRSKSLTLYVGFDEQGDYPEDPLTGTIVHVVTGNSWRDDKVTVVYAG